MPFGIVPAELMKSHGYSPRQADDAFLTHGEHLVLLDCIADLHRCRSLEKFPEHALRALAPLVPSTLSAFNEVNIPRNRIVAVADRPYPTSENGPEIWARCGGQHPLVRYVNDTGDGQAVKISDFLSVTEFHRLDLYRELYQILGAEDQMSVTIRSDRGLVIALAFNRCRRDFTETDRVKLNLVRPHLLQAYANVEEMTGHIEEKSDLMTALRESGQGVITLDPTGQVTNETPGVRDCLARYLGETAMIGGLPPTLRTWLRGGCATPFAARLGNAKLIVRSPPSVRGRLILVSEEIATGFDLASGLTAREREVLRWLAEGKTNSEIAIILAICSGTVKLHVEHILAKLGVANRTAAAAFAREIRLV